MIVVEQRTDVTVVRMARPPVNALDRAMIDGLRETFERLATRPPQAGVVLTGTGPAFSAGVDTKAFAAYGVAERRMLVQAITAMTARIFALSGPLVAAVNGHALGGGFVLMLCCDHRLAVDDDTIRLGLTEAHAGVPFPAGPAAIMKHEVPPALLRQLTLSSRMIGPRALAEQAVIDIVTDRDTLLDRAVASARELATQPAFMVVKRQLRGELADRLAALAASGDDPFIDSFATL
jgi:enoyl-CoA hydratase